MDKFIKSDKISNRRSWADKILMVVGGPGSINNSLEQRLFICVMFLSSLAGCTAFISNVFNSLDVPVQCTTLIIGLVFATLWILARNGVSYALLVYPSTIILIIVLSIEWFFNAGSRGGVSFYFLVCPFVSLIFSKGIGRLLTFCMYIATVIALIAIEYINPKIFMEYATGTQRLTDVSVSFFLCLIIASTFVVVIHEGYRKAIDKINEEKRESEARFFETADMLPVVICEVDSDLKISFINQAGRELTGFFQEDILKKRSILEIVHADDRFRAQTDLLKILAGENLNVREYRIIRKDGKTLWILLRCDQVVNHSNVAALRMCLIDISEQKLLQEQYRQAQKMESIGFLAGGMAHDFNNILSVIMGFAYLIQKDNHLKDKSFVNNKLEEQVSSILKAGERAADLVRKLLAFSRQGNFEIKPLNIHTLIDDVEALLSHSLDKKIAIIKNLLAPNPIVSGDQVLLQSALLNLAVNARDAMQNGGTLSFSTDEIIIKDNYRLTSGYTLPTGVYLAIKVGDTGIGMDENTRSHLFEPFFTTKEAGKGTGLGLASVFGTMQRHHGFIEAISVSGNGSTMILYLPMSTEKPLLAQEAPKMETPTKRLHVLVIDDETMICDFVKEYLDSEGYISTVFNDPMAATAWYKDHFREIDCAIIDMNMPRMDGRTCFLEMRKINPSVQGIFATGFAVGETAAFIRLPGIAGFIQKPFSLESLTRTLNDIVKKA